MPKSPKVPASKDMRHDPLEREYSWSEAIRQKAPKKRKHRQDNDTATEQVVDTRSAQKILQIGQDLADEDEQERQSKYVSGTNEGFHLDSRLQLDDEEEELDGQDEDTWEDDEEQAMEVEVYSN
jgi:essential nuclear protein 1